MKGPPWGHPGRWPLPVVHRTEVVHRTDELKDQTIKGRRRHLNFYSGGLCISVILCDTMVHLYMVALRATTFVVRRQLSTLRDDACCVECGACSGREKASPPPPPHLSWLI